MIQRSAFALALGLLALAPAPSLAAGERGVSARFEPPRDIGLRDPLRRTLLDALRPAIERDLKQPVQFVVRVLRVQGQWAFVNVVPQTRAGGAIDFRRTRYAEAIREGMFDGPDTFALLEDKAGRWTLRTFVIGPTDVPYAGWPEEYGAPAALFDLPEP